MRKVQLVRDRDTSSMGTFGKFVTDSGYTCATGELPDKNDAPSISCIPLGTYEVQWLWSEKHKCNLYHLLKVQGRDNIEIHASNFMGDSSQGYVSQLLGCISPGKAIMMFKAGSKYSASAPPLSKDQYGITSSHEALGEFHKDLQDQDGKQLPFELTIMASE